MPLSLAIERKLGKNGSVTCWGDTPTPDIRALDAPCSWIQYWAEVRTPGRAPGLPRLPEPVFGAAARGGPLPARAQCARCIRSWSGCRCSRSCPSDVRLQVWLAFGFLAVCLVNTVGLLLAKCLRRSPEIGVRRALGASEARDLRAVPRRGRHDRPGRRPAGPRLRGVRGLAGAPRHGERRAVGAHGRDDAPGHARAGRRRHAAGGPAAGVARLRGLARLAAQVVLIARRDRSNESPSCCNCVPSCPR